MSDVIGIVSCESSIVSRNSDIVSCCCRPTHINAILDLSIRKDILAELLRAINADVVMNNLKKKMINGWPENKADVLDD